MYITYIHIDKCRGHDRIVVGFIATCTISATEVVCSNSDHSEMYSIQHYVTKFSVTCDKSVVFSGYSGFLHQ